MSQGRESYPFTKPNNTQLYRSSCSKTSYFKYIYIFIWGSRQKMWQLYLIYHLGNLCTCFGGWIILVSILGSFWRFFGQKWAETKTGICSLKFGQLPKLFHKQKRDAFKSWPVVMTTCKVTQSGITKTVWIKEIHSYNCFKMNPPPY